MHELKTIELSSLSSVLGGIAPPPYPGGPHAKPPCRINGGEVGAWAAGGAIAGSASGPEGTVLGAAGGAVGDILSQVANGACKKK